MAASIQVQSVPKEFVLRRLHSLFGLWFLLFLIEHLFTNSLACLFFAGGGTWFVRSVDFLRSIPYLQIVEVALLGIPILYHSAWGIYYLISSRPNSVPRGAHHPKMTYGRSRAYTWQRITSVILLAGIVLHVIQMRFFDYPYKYIQNDTVYFYTKLHVDPGLYKAADQLKVTLYDIKAIEKEKKEISRLEYKIGLVEDRLSELKKEREEQGLTYLYDSELDSAEISLNGFESKKQHIKGLESRKISSHEVMAVSHSFGALELLNLRQAFQSTIMALLYTAFVLAAVFHGFNGLWTFLITWGVILSRKSHAKISQACIGLMFILGFLGLMSIWGTFFFTIG